MNQEGELYRGEKRDPNDIELTEKQYEAMRRLEQRERAALHGPLSRGAVHFTDLPKYRRLLK